MECKKCNAVGYYESQPECDRPASMCCGGCVCEVECEVCEGKGYLVPDYDDEFAHGLDIMIQRMIIRIMIQKSEVNKYFGLGEMDRSDYHANRVDSCERGLQRLENRYYSHIEKQRL